jgi:hypothetical protein
MVIITCANMNWNSYHFTVLFGNNSKQNRSFLIVFILDGCLSSSFFAFTVPRVMEEKGSFRTR